MSAASVQPKVADHYNQIKQKTREERQFSDILGSDYDTHALRLGRHNSLVRADGLTERMSLFRSCCSVKRFNNWIKSVLIHRYAAANAVILDLCCGKVR
jgi:hypothetical protein